MASAILCQGKEKHGPSTQICKTQNISQKSCFFLVEEKRQDQGATSWASVEVATTLSTTTAASVSLLLAISTSKDFLTENSVVLGVPFAICQFTFVSISCNVLVGGFSDF